jgi:hypothetical protein
MFFVNVFSRNRDHETDEFDPVIEESLVTRTSTILAETPEIKINTTNRPNGIPTKNPTE